MHDSRAIHIFFNGAVPERQAMGLSGIAPAVVSAIAFGVQYVPVKKYKFPGQFEIPDIDTPWKP